MSTTAFETFDGNKATADKVESSKFLSEMSITDLYGQARDIQKSAGADTASKYLAPIEINFGDDSQDAKQDKKAEALSQTAAEWVEAQKNPEGQNLAKSHIRQALAGIDQNDLSKAVAELPNVTPESAQAYLEKNFKQLCGIENSFSVQRLGQAIKDANTPEERATLLYIGAHYDQCKLARENYIFPDLEIEKDDLPKIAQKLRGNSK